jgi:hypothetical protein
MRPPRFRLCRPIIKSPVSVYLHGLGYFSSSMLSRGLFMAGSHYMVRVEIPVLLKALPHGL